ncbi:MAG: prepilin-type N-terminal cleavage/methylation domain-containing protein [Candidatus Hydrogenedentes bacterium]|nr:prepilin-type N-terminal cleavage/methylation domain-containing protein [Candidatus Hydrogenedentota bacterium]
MQNKGFSLLEVSMATAILSVVSLLSFIVVRTTTETADLSRAKTQIQADLRDTMTIITNRVQEAVTQRLTEVTGAPEDLAPIAVDEAGLTVSFQVPEAAEGGELYAFSTPIAISFENEDLDTGEGANGKLDEGEDTNADGVLTRRVVLTQDGVVTALASANNISGLQFELLGSQDTTNAFFTTLRIWLQASAIHGYGADSHLIRAELESRVYLRN